jgi:DNA-binding LacI/PurR family transcriptional regulator
LAESPVADGKDFRPAELRPGRLPTLADVAGEAGVSLSTASRALHGKPAVTRATRRRVESAARRLGYEPNRIARSLRTRSSTLVGVIVPDIGIGFYARTVKGAQNVLERAGYSVLVMSTERAPEREAAALRTLLSHRVDGVLLATSGGFAATPRVPVVFFDNLVEGVGVANVARANREGVALLVGHLVEHGHERIAYIGGPAVLTSGVERLDGFRAALAEHGLRGPDDCVRFGDAVWSARSGAQAMRELLELRPPPTAVVAASDTFALGAMEVIRSAGLSVPGDVALVSFDDPFFGDLLDPPITALARNERELGELAASLLLHALKTGATSGPTEVRLPVELVVRRSCGCGERA